MDIRTVEQLEEMALAGKIERDDIMRDDALYGLWCSNRVGVESALEEYRERFFDQARSAVPEKISVYIKSDEEEAEVFRGLELLHNIEYAVSAKVEQAGITWRSHYASSWADLKFPAYFGQEILIIDGTCVPTDAARASTLIRPSTVHPSHVVAIADTVDVMERFDAMRGHPVAESLTLIFDIFDTTTRAGVRRPLRLNNGAVRIVDDRTCELDEIPDLVAAEVSV